MKLIDNSIKTFEEIQRTFSWQIPNHFNIATAVCDRHSGIADQVAMYYENSTGKKRQHTFGEFGRWSRQLANALAAMGLKPGDRVAILLSQRPETAIAHLATYRLGAIALPLSILFGPDALGYRLSDSGATVVITDSLHAGKVRELQSDLPNLKSVIDCDDDSHGFWQLINQAADNFETVQTKADDPALLIYTSGTTGPAKGALVAHRSLLGNLTGFELSQNFFPQQEDVFWTPADWAWTGGLMDGLLPTWFYGKPILGYEGGKFDPEIAFKLMERYQVTNTFIPPTALKMMRQVANPDRFNLALRAIMSAGEAVGAELIHWAEEVLHVHINEMWGQTEFNYLVGNCSAIMEVRPGSMGKAYPGHRVEIIDDNGNPVASGETGELAAWAHDPVMFLGYWQRDEATRDKLKGNWFCTGDVGYKDEDDYIWFTGRKDDVISSAGYRIGPGEIEDCLLKHPAVSLAAVIGKPDDLRGSIVKAFIILAKEYEPTEALKKEIQVSVKNQLAAYEYPREIEFIDELPMTTTGKVRRVELRSRD